jgi:hypothetical protein
MAKLSLTVDRPIYFCKAYVGGKSDPKVTEKVAHLLPEINKLDFDFGKRYLGGPDDLRWSCVWVHRPEPPCRLTIAWLTDKDLPQTEEHGKISELELKEGQHLRHPAHMVLFEEGVLGFEYWKPAPRPWSLAQYLNERGFVPPGTRKGRLSFDFVYKTDVLADLRNASALRTLRIRIPVSKAAALEAANETLGTSLKILGHIGDEVVADLEVRPPTRTRGPLRALKDIAMSIARVAKETGFEKLEATGYDEEGEEIALDLLNPRIMQIREMVLLGRVGKAVQSESAYSAIERSFKQQKEAILDAAGRTAE